MFDHHQVSTEISRLQKNVQHVSSQENDVTSIRSYLIVTYGTGRVDLKKKSTLQIQVYNHELPKLTSHQVSQNPRFFKNLVYLRF